jgi:pimeloyl-ACP methyl ester carboxylesterase
VIRRLAVVLALAVLPAACSASPHPAASQFAASQSPSLDRPVSPGPVGADCLTRADRAGAVRFASGSGAELAGVLLGQGRSGVVLAHGQHGDVCEWLPYARVLVGLGYRVLLFDFNGSGASGLAPDAPARPHYDLDVVAAIGRLRGTGVDRIALLGSETGGLAAVIAAADVRPPVAGVVAVSSPSAVSGMDGVAAAGRLAVPALFVESAEDPWLGEMRQLYRADRYPDRHLEEVPGYGHGPNLLDPAMEQRAGAVRGLVEAFIGRVSR